MQKCLQCSKEFKYTQVIKTVTGLLKWNFVTCNDCGKQHIISFTSRSVISVLLVAFPMLVSQYIFKEPALLKVLLLFVIWIITILLVSPFFIKYKEQ